MVDFTTKCKKDIIYFTWLYSKVNLQLSKKYKIGIYIVDSLINKRLD